MTDNLDLRSLSPTFERKITWTDGTEYAIREIDDLTEAEFIGLLSDEQKLADLSIVEQRDLHKRHLQMMIVVPITLGVIGALEAGDIVYRVGVGSLARNTVTDDSGAFATPWPSGLDQITYTYRSIRRSEIDNLTERQFSGVLRFVKTPPKKDGEEEGKERPPIAASESTSSISSPQ